MSTASVTAPDDGEIANADRVSEELFEERRADADAQAASR